MTEVLLPLLFWGAIIVAAAIAGLYVLGLVGQVTLLRRVEREAGLTPSPVHFDPWSCVMGGWDLVCSYGIYPLLLGREMPLLGEKEKEQLESLPDESLERLIQVARHMAQEEPEVEAPSRRMEKQALGIGVYEPRGGWDKLLNTVVGPEYRVWRSARAASPEACARLLRAVKQYRAIERETRELERAKEMGLFEKRWDKASAFLVVFYPKADRLLTRAAVALVFLVILVGSLTLIGRALWH